ncbi:unnamed protein product, partial [Oppiella nova]
MVDVVSDEQLSPVCDYSDYMTQDNQVKVGISPTDELLSQTRAYETHHNIPHESNDSKPQNATKDALNSATESDSSYENNAFAGKENIDTFPADSEPRSPYEVLRGKGSESEKDSHYKFDNKRSDSLPKDKDSDRDKDNDKGSDKDRDERRVVEIEGKMKKQIVSEIFAKELNEEVVNGSPERKIIRNENTATKSKIMSVSEEINYEEIRREAQIIAQTIVVKAKQELAKIPNKSNISEEISDEDLVEQEREWDEADDMNRVVVDSPVSPISPDPLRAQKRISFTESEPYVRRSSIVLDKNISPDELKRTLSNPATRKSSDSGSRSGSRSGSQREKESGSSSESHYHSFEVSDSSRTPVSSRPTSSEFDLTIIPELRCSSSRSSGGFGTTQSEYETCVTSQEGSYMTAASSQDTSYHTARTSVRDSSRDSTISIESESSGNLAEMSSEASETLVEEDIERHGSVTDDDFEPAGSLTPVNDFKEPFDCEIPESVIRGGVEMPFMSGTNWGEQRQQPREPKASTSYEMVLSEVLEETTSELTLSANRAPLLPSNSVDESISENSNTWHSSSVGTAVPAGHPNSGNGSLTSLGQSGSSGACEGSTQFRSFSESMGSLETLNTTEMQQNMQTGGES